MPTTKLSSKGQVVIPKEIRAARQWSPGTELVVEEFGDAILLRPHHPFPSTELTAGLGCTGYRGPRHSVEEMHRGIDEEIRRRWEEQ
jgi:AbrB family looped-hinge helix DNA binding protein